MHTAFFILLCIVVAAAIVNIPAAGERDAGKVAFASVLLAIAAITAMYLMVEGRP